MEFLGKNLKEFLENFLELSWKNFLISRRLHIIKDLQGKFQDI